MVDAHGSIGEHVAQRVGNCRGRCAATHERAGDIEDHDVREAESLAPLPAAVRIPGERVVSLDQQTLERVGVGPGGQGERRAQRVEPGDTTKYPMVILQGEHHVVTRSQSERVADTDRHGHLALRCESRHGISITPRSRVGL